MQNIYGTVSINDVLGTEVKNLREEHLGTIEDIMLDLQTGKIAYLVLSYGGIFGTTWADKRFAVPLTALSITEKDDEFIYHLDVSKEVLENAPGFDKDHYPDYADNMFLTNVNNYYSNLSHRSVV